MPRTINTGNAIGAALRWIFPADEATLPYPDDASAIDVIAGANAAINNGAPSLGPLSARPSAGGQTAAGGFRSNSIPSGLTYPITLALKHVISQSPAGGEPVLGVFRWSAKFCGISYVTSPPRFQATVRNEGAIASIDGPALLTFDGVQNLALIVTSPTQRALYINGTRYVDSSGATVDYTASPIFQRIGVGAAFDDTGAVIGSGSGNSAWAALFEAALSDSQLATYFADPAGTVFLPPPAVLTGSITTDAAAPTGTLGSLAPASLTGNITTDAAAPTGNLGTGAGTITTGPWKNDAGDPQPSLTVPLVTVLRRSDGVQVLTLANQVTSSSPTAPVIAVSNAALVPGVFYMVASWNADGSLYGIEPYQAA